MHTVKVLGDYIRGKFVRSRGADRKIVSKDPGDAGYRIGSFSVNASHVDGAVDAARKALVAWSDLTQVQRANALRKFSAQVFNHRDELAALISTETGKPLWEARQEVMQVEEQVETEIREGIRSVSPFKVGEVRWGVEGYCRFKPIGVVAVLGSAASPVRFSCGHIIPALLAGNTVVFKPSKLVPATGQFIARMFDLADIPPGVFNLIQGDAAIGLDLAAHMDVEGVMFTGSQPAGKRILQATHDQLFKLVTLQIGGVNLALVLDDALLEQAVFETVLGSFLTTGQQYTSTGVILVERSIFKKFLEAFVSATTKLKVGYAFDEDVFMGPVLTESARVRFLDRQQQLERLGTESIITGSPIKTDRPGYFLGPAVHVIEKPDSIDAISPEGMSFGPDVVLVAVSDADEAVRLANRNRYSYVSSVFTRDKSRFEICAKGLGYGVINHNLATTDVSLRLPLMGTRECGNFRPAGVFSQRNCTYPVASLEVTTTFDPNRKFPGFPVVEISDG